MVKIEGFRICNFKILRDVTFGRLWDTEGADELTPLTAVIGKNGVGKSALFDAFGFLSDCLKLGLEEACRIRNGFERLRSQGADGAYGRMSFEIYYREKHDTRPITYEVSFGADVNGRPYIGSERLHQRKKGQTTGQPYSFLIVHGDIGLVWKGEYNGIQKPVRSPLIWEEIDELMRKYDSHDETEIVELQDSQRLCIATLGMLKQHPRIFALRKFIEDWYLSYFTPNAARGLPLSGPQKRLNILGDNIGNVVEFMERSRPKQFQKILDDIAEKIPGINKISTERMPDGRLLLKFNDNCFEDAFSVQQMSDGTLKVFAYLLMLSDPEPPPFICIEEPENGLYHKLLETLMQQFRAHASDRKDGSQIFITTHQPYIVDALEPNEVWILERGEDGFSTVRRASEDPVVSGLVEEGLPLGSLWYSDYLERSKHAL